MKTLSPTEARANLTRWLDQAIAGKNIGITHKGHIIKLQTVPVIEDWAATEYGLTSDELNLAGERLVTQGENLVKTGKTISWSEFKKRRKV